MAPGLDGWALPACRPSGQGPRHERIASAGRFRLTVSVLVRVQRQARNKITRIDPERIRQAKQALQREVAVAALDAGHERPVQRTALGEGLQRLALGLSGGPDPIAELDSRAHELVGLGLSGAGHALTPSGSAVPSQSR